MEFKTSIFHKTSKTENEMKGLESENRKLNEKVVKLEA